MLGRETFVAMATLLGLTNTASGGHASTALGHIIDTCLLIVLSSVIIYRVITRVFGLGPADT